MDRADDRALSWKRKAAELARYFHAIPDSEWTVGRAGEPGGGRYCAWGQLVHSDRWADATMLQYLLGSFPGPLSDLNNGTSGTCYDKLPTPRLRIVAALTDIALGVTLPWVMDKYH